MDAGFVCILNTDYTKVLAVNRRNSDLVGFPGGKYETTDINIEATAIRESKEETGFDFTDYIHTQVYNHDGIVTFFATMSESLIPDGSNGIESDIATIWLPINEFIDRSEFKEYNREVFNTKIIADRIHIRMSKCQTFLYYYDMKFMASDETLGCNGCYFLNNNATESTRCTYASHTVLRCLDVNRADTRSVVWLRIA